MFMPGQERAVEFGPSCTSTIHETILRTGTRFLPCVIVQSHHVLAVLVQVAEAVSIQHLLKYSWQMTDGVI
jgi:hypothetical protein